MQFAAKEAVTKISTGDYQHTRDKLDFGMFGSSALF